MEKKKKLSDSIFENIIIAVAIMLYFIIINFSYYRVDDYIVLMGLKISSIIILLISILIFEIAYKKDNGTIAIYGIEILVLSIYVLLIPHIIERANLEFTNYILVSSYVFTAYYMLKSMIIYTIDRKRYLNSLSDIKDIVDTKPIKKKRYYTYNGETHSIPEWASLYNLKTKTLEFLDQMKPCQTGYMMFLM